MNKSISKKFTNNGYDHIKGLINKKKCKELSQKLFLAVSKNETYKDSQCPLSDAVYGLEEFDKLLEDLLPSFEKYSGKKLIPTYSYARIYRPGDELKSHRDRPSCEISATITLGCKGKDWPIYMGDREDKVGGKKILMAIGDAVIYKGQEKWHWRGVYKGDWQAQVFLHYVDADGPNVEFKYDKRDGLTHHKNENNNHNLNNVNLTL